MNGRLLKSTALSAVLAVALAGCDNNPYGEPYIDLGRDLAGVYNPIFSGSALNMRIVLGTRFSVSGRYNTGDGDVRFSGTWDRVDSVLRVNIENQDLLPPTLLFDVTREVTLTEIPRSPFAMTPETDPPLFLEQEVMRLRGTAVIGTDQIDLDLVRVITDVTGGGGGPGAASVAPRGN